VFNIFVSLISRLADELRYEQDIAQAIERDRKLLECQAKDIQVKINRQIKIKINEIKLTNYEIKPFKKLLCLLSRTN
jgi:hypothetical protein